LLIQVVGAEDLRHAIELMLYPLGDVPFFSDTLLGSGHF
jgi:hypothetical protein